MAGSSNAVRMAVGALLTLALSSGAWAQSPGADEASGDVAIAQNLATAPAAGAWLSSLNFTFQRQGGRTESLNYDVDLIVAHATKHIALIRLDAEVRKSEYQAVRDGDLITSDDNRTASITMIPRIKGRVSAIAIASTHVDHPAGLAHRTMLQLGPYLMIAHSPKFSWTVAPLGGIGRQDNASSPGTHGIESFGAMQSLTWAVTKTATLNVYGAAHRNIDLSSDHAVLVNSSLSATMSKYVTLSLSHSYSLEGVHPVGTSAVQTNIGAGIGISVR